MPRKPGGNGANQPRTRSTVDLAAYPRSVGLIVFLREEARTQEEQVLTTDLFQRITLYDLKVEEANFYIDRNAGDNVSPVTP